MKRSQTLALCTLMVTSLISGCNCDTDGKQISKILEKHPEIIFNVLESNKELLTKVVQLGQVELMEKEQFAAMSEEIDKESPQTLNTDNALSWGNLDAKHQIVIYSHFLCPHCEHHMQAVSTLPDDLAHVTIKHLPSHAAGAYLSSIFEAACMSEGADVKRLHGVFFDMGRAMQGDKDQFAKELLDKTGLELDDLETLLKDEKLQKRLQEQAEEAHAMSIGATPTSFIDGLKVTGAISAGNLNKIIEHINKLTSEK